MLTILATICCLGMVTTSNTPKKNDRLDSTKEINPERTMIVGTYTAGTSKGIYSFRFNEETGMMTPLSEVNVQNPSYLTPSADGRFVYAVSEFSDERAAVNAFAFNKKKGTFRLLNTQKTEGADPCYLLAHNKQVVAANYSGGSISVFPIKSDGSLLQASSVLKFTGSGANKEHQEKSHLHCVRITPDNRFLFANDLGTDQIYKYILHPTANGENKEVFLTKGTPTSFKVKAGSGPRHLTFSPSGQYAYLINELSGTVIAFQYREGELKEIQMIAADTVGAKGSADIHISPDGNFLYASNRLKADGIAIFSIHPNNGMLTKVGYQLTGIHPRNFSLSPNGKFLLVACRDSNVIQVYKRNINTGMLTDIHKEMKIDKPVCIKFVP